MRPLFSALAIGLLFSVPPAPAHAQSATRDAPVAAAQTLDTTRLAALLRDAIPAPGADHPGHALLVMRRGELIYSSSAGRISPSTVVPIASASKWLAGAVIMSLVDEGLLALDDTLGRFFQGLEAPLSRITVRQLFSHTSGLPAEAPCLGSAAGSLATCAEEILARSRRGAVPGRRFAYGGASMQVAGRVAEIAGGAPWEQLFRRRIAIPLGLERTTFSPRGGNNPRIAGGVHASAEDYARFLTMIASGGSADGKRVLSPGAVHDMLADQTRGAAMRADLYRNLDVSEAARPRVRYGIGVWRETFSVGGAESIEHASPGALGFVPWFDPEHDIVGVFVTVRPLDEVMPMVLEARRLVRESAGNR